MSKVLKATELLLDFMRAYMKDGGGRPYVRKSDIDTWVPNSNLFITEVCVFQPDRTSRPAGN